MRAWLSSVAARVLQFLRGLAAYRFALMLGCGVVGLGLSIWLIIIIGYGVWPAPSAPARIAALREALLVAMGLMALVLVGVAFGRLDRLSLKAGLVEANVEFEDEPPVVEELPK